jgi:hypothetical protein
MYSHHYGSLSKLTRQLVSLKIPRLDQRGMINFDLKSTDNAAALCPSCHRQYDVAIDPGWVFFPSDLKYFIRFEEADYKRRREEGGQGRPSHRQCPTAQMYRDHQAQLLPTDSPGGLYRRVVLKPFFSPLAPPPDAFSEPKAWHGAPTAALRRAVAALGSIDVTSIDSRSRADLRRLQELYGRGDPPVIARRAPRQAPDQAPDQAPKTAAGKRRRGKDDSPKNESLKVRRTTRGGHESTVSGAGTRRTTRTTPGEAIAPYVNASQPTCQHPNESGKSGNWVLGPSISSWDAAERYQSLFSKNTEA